MAVEFEEQEFAQSNQRQQAGSQGAVTNLILKIGLAKTAAQANVVMLIIAVLAIGLAVYLMLPTRATAPALLSPIPGQALPADGL